MSWLLLLVACEDPKTADTGTLLTGPGIAFAPLERVAAGTPVVVQARVTDPEGVGAVSFFYRRTGDDAWSFEPLSRGEDDTWSVELDGDQVIAPGLDYYLKAVDAGDVTATSYFPDSGVTAPLSVPVYVQGEGFPFVEDFEFEEGATRLRDRGWASASLGFRGEGWVPTRAQAHGGDWSLVHGTGGQSEEPYEDWLISPPIDLTSARTAQVSWWERGLAVERADHQLMVSMGSRDPSSGDWTPLPVAGATSLPAPPEGTWGRSAFVDLTPYVGQPAVYLAWVYRGLSADTWSLDDVRVEAHQPDLDVTLTVMPSPIEPGQDGLLTVDLVNLGLVDASDAAVSLSFPEGGASVSEGSVPADVPVGGSASVPFTLRVDEAAPDNAWIPVTVSLELADGGISFEERVLVGVPSTAHVAWDGSASGLVTLTLGVGDPEAPSWSEVVYQDVSTDFELDVDVTDQRAFLPVVAGPDRWFLKVESAESGRLRDFRVSFDGVETVASLLPSVSDGGSGVALLPTPPVFSGSFSTNPRELSPGLSGAMLSATLTNVGAATSGAVSATLSSTDPHVTVTDGGPVALAPGGLSAGEIARLTDAFSFDISADHVDSSDVLLDLVLTDEIESFLVPVTLDVPSPWLRVATITVTDDGGDGAIDPEEHAQLSISVTNAGDRSTSGTVRGSLALDPASPTSATVSTNSESYGSLGVRQTRSPYRPWDVTVEGGAAGDALDLLLSVTDSYRTWELPVSLTLGEPPWQPLSTLSDRNGDVLGGSDLDIARARWRVRDDLLQLEVESWTAFDPSTAFIESWMYSAGARWTFYRLVLQSGVVQLQGYGTSGFENISVPEVRYPDATTVQFDLHLSDMGLTLPSLNLGLAAGWCGPPDYYCDQHPDGWGYPYTAWSPSLFYTIDW